MRSRRFWVVSLVALALTWALLLQAGRAPVARVGAQQPPHDQDTCADVRYLMDLGVVPAELFNATEGQRVLQPFTQQYGDLSPTDMGDYWAFVVQSNEDEEKDASAIFQFSEMPEGFPLEFAVFKGMERVFDYTPITNNSVYSVPLTGDGVYTAVVQLVHVSDLQRIPQTAAGIMRYGITAQFQGGGDPSTALWPLEDSARQTYTPQTADGLEVVPSFPNTGAHVEFHMNSLVQGVNIGTQYGTQLFFGPSGSLLLGDWAQFISYTGGNLSAKGYQKSFFLEDFGYRNGITDALDLNALRDSNNTTILTDWQNILGIWVTHECAGFTLQQSENSTVQFVIPLDAGNPARTLTFEGQSEPSKTGCSYTYISVLDVPFAPDQTTVNYRLCASLKDFREQSVVSVQNGVTEIPLKEDRMLRLTYPDISIAPLDDAPNGESFPLRATVKTSDGVSTEVVSDWTDLATLNLSREQLGLLFRDPVRAANGETVRVAVGLRQFTLRDGIIHLVYDNGHERLLLPQDESYLEIVTPPGEPSFNGATYIPDALPGEPGYQPRALNNTGGNCTPLHNGFPEANCPPSGHINPANGNVWYAVTDLFAHGNFVDLVLQRSFNNGNAAIDGPFGMGWTTALAFDYDLPFNPITNSRVVALEGDPLQGGASGVFPASTQYHTALDLTWAPRGLVVYTDADGSRHAFLGEVDPTNGRAVLRANMMPGWKLTRESYQDGWTLTKEDGYVIRFDRAGRTRQFGYPVAKRMITIHYPYNLLNGTAELGDTPVYVTDTEILNAAERRIELYFDGDHHITRAILREMRDGTPTTPEQCALEDGCYETRYYYVSGRLDHVIYPSGQNAEYAYNTQGWLTEYNDPHAPITPHMRYMYSGRGEGSTIEATVARPSGEDIRYETLRVLQMDGSQRTVRLTDYLNNPVQYTYKIADGSWQQSNGNFTLVEHVSPTPTPRTNDDWPVTYTWSPIAGQQAGELLQNVSGGDRLSVGLHYGPTGQVYDIYRGTTDYFPLATDVVDTGNNSTFPGTVSLINGESYTYTYNELGNVETITTASGEVWEYVWGTPPFVRRINHLDHDQLVEYWVYEFDNKLGLPSTITFYNGHPDCAGVTTRYTWDKLGRLTRIEDFQLGTYTIAYTPTQPTGDYFSSTVTLIGPLGEQYISTYDGRGQLKQYVVKNSAGDPLRQTDYSYDVLGRLVEEARLLRPPAGDQTTTLTTYTYQLVPELPELKDTEHPELGEIAPATPINGYSVTKTDPLGRQSVAVYDARGRIRSLTDELGYTKRFDYYTADLRLSTVLQTNLSWLYIVQWDTFAGEVLAETTYVFDIHGNFRGAVRRAPGEQDAEWRWNLTTDATKASTQALINRSGATNHLDFSWNPAIYQAGMPQDISLSGNALAATPGMQVVRDALGRPVQLIQRTDADHTVEQSILYCPQADGTETVMRFLPNTAPDKITCEADSTTFELAVTRDHLGRVGRVETPQGLVTISTEADPTAGVWRVHFWAENTRWEATYNALGELLTWESTQGIQRRYTYDTLGRLRRVEVSQLGQVNLEESYTFDYNAIGYLTSAVNDLGRGERYAYNADGLLVAKVDAVTMSTTSYEYNDRKRLQTVITPTGEKTTYTYDAHFPSRLVSVVTASTEHHFAWDTAEAGFTHSLTYTDHLGHNVIYHFDPLGLLQRVDLEEGLSYTLEYNDQGLPTQWDLHTPQTTTTRGLALQYTPEAHSVSVSPENTEKLTSPWQWAFAFTPDGWLQTLQAVDVSATFDYNALGQLQAVDAGAERTWTLERFPEQAAVALTDDLGQEQRYTFDSQYRTRTVSVNGKQTVAYAYNYTDKAAIVLNVTRGDQTVTYESTPARPERNVPTRVTVTTAQGKTIYAYNADGELTDITIEENFAVENQEAPQVRRTHIEFVFGANGLPQYIINSAEGVEGFEYDSVGNLSGYQNASGQSFTYAYNALNQLVAIVGPGGWKTVIGYDGPHVIGVCQTGAENSNDYAECVENSGHLLESYTYDMLGRLATQTFLNGEGESTITYRYEAPNGALSAWGIDSENIQTQLEYEPSAADVLQAVQMGPAIRYAVSYDATGHVRSVHTANLALEISRDEQGRVTKIFSGDRSLSYTYFPQGYTVTDDQSGAWISFTYDDNQHLHVLDYHSANGSGTTDTPLLSVEYLGVDSENTLGVSLDWSDQYLTDLYVDAQGNIFYVDHSPPEDGAALDVLLQYVFDRAKDPIQQNIRSTVPEHVFGILDAAQNESEYLVIIGYNEAHQPLTLRIFNTVTPDAAEQFFYSQSFTYDRFGRVEGETRQYHDGTRIIISYTFANGIQLSRQTVHVIPPSSDVAQPTQMFTYYYEYDPMGNVTRVFEREPQTGIETTCAQFGYDTVNHLLHVTTRNGSETSHYFYDVQGRLVADDDYTFIYDEDATATPVAAYRNGDPAAEMRFFASMDSGFALFQTRDGQAYHLFDSGQEQIIGAQAVGPTDTLPPTLWLLDPYGRTISVAVPDDENGGRCFLFEGPSVTEDALQPPQTVFDGMFWDQRANLFFDGARVYLPTALQYLQRDPNGPDAHGNLYRYPAGQTEIPLRRQSAPYLTGIRVLQESYANFTLRETLTAESVLAQHAPHVAGVATNDASRFLGAAAQMHSRVLDWLVLPYALNRGYNVPAPSFDWQTGRLEITPETVVGQAGLQTLVSTEHLKTKILFSTAGDWLTPTFETSPETLSYFATELSRAAPPAVPLRTPTTPTWFVPTGPFGSEAARYTPYAPPPNTPEDVLSYTPFLEPGSLFATDTLDLLVLLEELPTRRASDWVNAALIAALPTEPEWLPPQVDELSGQWFTHDIFGMSATFGARTFTCR